MGKNRLHMPAYQIDGWVKCREIKMNVSHLLLDLDHVVLAFHQEQLLLPGQPAQTIPLFRIQTSRFLHQTMFPRFEGRLGVSEMSRIRGSYVDDI